MFRYTPIVLALLACRTDKSITVQNPAPQAEIISHSDGDSVFEGFATLFVGNVTDANHTADQLTTRWYLDGETICEDLVPDEDGETQCELTLGTESSEVTLAVLDADNARGETTIVVNVESTEAPNAQIVTPTADGVYYSDQKITFEGLVSDAEDAPELLTAFWESDIDGVLSNVDTEVDSTGAVIGYEYLTEGEHAIELHVEDSTGKTARETVVVDVGPPNSAPLCELLTPDDGSAGAEGSLVTFTGTTSDVDVAPGWLTVTWTSDKDGEIGASTPNSDGTISFAYANLTVDTHNITLTVTDEVGAICTDSAFYTVGTPPSISIDTPSDGDIISEGSPISFSATLSDAQDQPDVIALDWVANGTSISTQGATSSGTASFSDSSLVYGTYNLVVTATDSDGLTDSDQINFTVNGLPTTPVVSIAPSTPTTADGLNVSLDIPSTDPEGNTVSYSYEWQLGGQTQSTQITSSLPSSVTSKGEQWTVVVTPNDGIADGVAGMASVVIGNTAPTVGVVTVTPAGTVYNDDVLTCSATVTDPDETPTTTYEWTIGGVVVGAGSTVDLSTSGAMPGDAVVCTVTASDGVDTATNSGSQSIANRNPSITASITTNGTNQAAELTCVGTASDADGETPTVTYEWFNSSTSLGSANPLQLDSTLASSGDVIDCVTTATDGYGGNASDTASHIVTNTAPVISSVNVTPAGTVYNDDVLTCSATVIDPDETPTTTYEWTIDGVVVGTGSTLDLSTSSTLPGDTVVCTATASDGVDTATNSGSQSIANRNPSITASITTNGTTQNAELTCVGTASDADGETPTVTYEWFNSSTSLGSANPLQLDSTLASSGDVIDCVTTATDGYGGNASATASHTVTNTAPVISSVNVTPDPATVGQDDLTCSVVASDADGDSLLYSYEWSDSNGVQQTTTLVSATTDVYLTSGLTDDTWTCEVTPYDGSDYGNSYVDTVLVESCTTGLSSDCAATSCLQILNNGNSQGNGVYWIDPDGNGAFEAYCDMTTDGGGWTRVVTINASSKAHAGNVNAVGNVTNLSSAAKLTDNLISVLNTQGYWWYKCGNSKDVYVRTASGNFNSNYTNSENWSIDNQKDGVFECLANRAGYVFADYPYCAAGHSDYGSPSDGNGCYVDGEGWGRSGALWAR